MDKLNTIFFEAAKNGDYDKLDKCIDAGADIEATNERYGETALMMASYRGHTPVVKLLLENGANIEAKDYDGWTALMWASIGGDIEVVELLIERGADIDVTDGDGKTALMLASKEGRTEVVKFLKNFMEEKFLNKVIRDNENEKRVAAERRQHAAAAERKKEQKRLEEARKLEAKYEAEKAERRAAQQTAQQERNFNRQVSAGSASFLATMSLATPVGPIAFPLLMMGALLQ